MSVASQFATRGKKILAIGRNYAAHIAELKNTTPSEPFFFLKPTTCYVTDNGAVEQPRGIELHHEVELGVIIGKKGRDITAEKAFDHVAGYTISVDYTGRNFQAAVKAKGLPWSAAKGFDTWCPVGRFISKEEVKDPHNLTVWYSVNGEPRQRGSTNLMLYKIPELIAHCSSIMTLEEGDLILTGTPEGVSQIFPGDKITAGLEQEGKSLDEISHVIVAREGGYEFKGK